MLDGDRVEDGPDGPPSSAGAARPGTPGSFHWARARRTISARTASASRSARSMIRAGVSSSSRSVRRSLAAKSSGPRRPSPADRGRTSSRRIVSARASAALAEPAATRSRSISAATAGSPGAAWTASARASSISSPMPGQLGQGRLGVQAGHRPAVGRPDEGRPGGLDHVGQALEAAGDRGQPIGQRGELAGDQGEDPGTQDVDPLERVPGQLEQIGLCELDLVEDQQEQPAVDLLVAFEVGRGDRPEQVAPAPGCTPAGCAGRLRSGPASDRRGRASRRPSPRAGRAGRTRRRRRRRGRRTRTLVHLLAGFGRDWA